VINISNSTSIDKPLWQLEAPAGPKPRPGRGQRQPVAGRAAARRPAPDGTGPRCLGALATAGWIVLSWLAAVPRRLGDRLFAMNDTEAYWCDWEILETRCGLGRRYRDPRFDTLAECQDTLAECQECRGAGIISAVLCLPCAGTGLITGGEVS